ncbi:DNA topoisomerase [Propionivibrio sp.]|uniref:DNA topoisomerase n=1 Tax=Propionivibrio sp. TaxID=2212460 RepID=UPI0039E60A2A
MKTLIVAEKSSVAKDIAKALGGFTGQGDYLEREDILVTSARGHLAGLQVSEAAAGATLPIIPAEFGVAPIDDDCAKRIRMIAGLAKKKDVTRIVNACDAGREGELIFWYVFQCIDVAKPFFRMWMQSMTDGAIRQAFAQMAPAADKAGLLAAARSRAEADWLVGINGSRAFTQLLRMATGQRINVTVGRVQTPTLSLIVHRELQIRHFKPRDYYEVHATFHVRAGQYVGRWVRQQPSGDDDSKHRMSDLVSAQAIVATCRNAGGDIRVREESKPTSRSPGKLFDLTSLQREANTRFGFTAKQTLDLAQSLYEKHKATSYPRTDSSFLPDDYPGKVRDILGDLSNQDVYSPLATAVLSNDWVAANGKTFDSSKVSDHFAIIPTGQAPRDLAEAEQQIYDLVVRRFIAVFYPAARYLQTIRTTLVGSETFLSTGKVLKPPGWLAVYGRAADEDDADPELCPLDAGETVGLSDIEAKAKQTTSPKRFTEATLLTAMEHASADIEDDDDARQAMAEKGLGTPATRAATIEGLVEKGYASREGKQFVPTERGLQLVQQLERLQLGLLTSAKLTGEWEHKLGLVNKGRESRATFMAEIADFTRGIVTRLEEERSQLKPRPSAQSCPDCGFPMLLGQSKFKAGARYWECSNYPTCRTKCDDVNGKPGRKKEAPPVSTEHLCPDCGKSLIFRRGVGKKGPWKMWTCSGYPECTAKFDDAGGKPIL